MDGSIKTVDTSSVSNGSYAEESETDENNHRMTYNGLSANDMLMEESTGVEGEGAMPAGSVGVKAFVALASRIEIEESGDDDDDDNDADADDDDDEDDDDNDADDDDDDIDRDDGVGLDYFMKDSFSKLQHQLKQSRQSDRRGSGSVNSKEDGAAAAARTTTPRRESGGLGRRWWDSRCSNGGREGGKKESLFLTNDEYVNIHLIKFRLAESEAEREELLDRLGTIECKSQAAEQATTAREAWLCKEMDYNVLRRDMDKVLAERAVLLADNTTLQMQLTAVTRHLDRAMQAVAEYRCNDSGSTSTSSTSARPSLTPSAATAALMSFRNTPPTSVATDSTTAQPCLCNNHHSGSSGSVGRVSSVGEEDTGGAKEREKGVTAIGVASDAYTPECNCPELIRVLEATKDMRQENADKTADLEDIKRKLKYYVEDMTRKFEVQAAELDARKVELRHKDDEVYALKEWISAHVNDLANVEVMIGDNNSRQSRKSLFLTPTSSAMSSATSSPSRHPHARSSGSGGTFFARFRKTTGGGGGNGGGESSDSISSVVSSGFGSSFSTSEVESMSSSICLSTVSSVTSSSSSGGGGGGGGGSSEVGVGVVADFWKHSPELNEGSIDLSGHISTAAPSAVDCDNNGSSGGGSRNIEPGMVVDFWKHERLSEVT